MLRSLGEVVSPAVTFANHAPHQYTAETAGSSAPVSAHRQQGASPCRADVHPRVIERNCAAARRGGKQREVNDRSEGDELDSASQAGEHAGELRSPEPPQGSQ